MTIPAKKPLKDWTPEDYNNVTAEEAIQLNSTLRSQGNLQTANAFMQTWSAYQSADEAAKTRRAQERANDPLQQLPIVAGVSGATALGSAGGTALVNAATPAPAAAAPHVVAVTQTSAGPVAVWSNGAAGPLGTVPAAPTATATTAGAGTAGTAGTTGATTAAGAAPSTPTGITATPVATEGGFGSTVATYAPYVAAALAAYQGGVEAMDRNDRLQNNQRDPIRGAEAGYKEWWNDVKKKPLENWYQLNPFAPQLSIGQGIVDSIFGSGKSRDQLKREAVVGNMERLGYVPDNSQFTFSDQSTYDFGKDGGFKLPNVGISELQPSGFRHAYDVDWTDPNAGALVGAANPLAIALSQSPDEDLQAQIAGKFTNAMLSGGADNSSAHIRDLYYGLPGNTPMDKRNLVYQGVLDSYDAGNITADARNAALAEIDKQFGVANPNQGKGGELEFGPMYIKPGDELKKKVI